MREIKFRAWDRLEKKMHPGMLLVLLAGWMTGKYSLGEDLGRYEFIEFTGLKDKNGEEIYEGDIVKTNMWNYVRSSPTVCRITYQAPTFICIGTDGTTRTLDDFPVEVIGNIYENPDLLEKKEEKGDSA